MKLSSRRSGFGGVVAVPRLDVKAGRDQGGVEAIVNVEEPELFETVAVGELVLVTPTSTGSTYMQAMRLAWRRIRRLEHADGRR